MWSLSDGRFSHGPSLKVSSSQKIRMVGEDRRSAGKVPAVTRTDAGQYDYSKNYDPISRISSNFMNEESTPDAVSEKELVGVVIL